MRLFIAVELNEILKEEIYKIQKKLMMSTKNYDIKWVEKENLHLTLKFLGEVEESRLESISSITKSVATKTKNFDITISNIGVFPDEKFARVLWLGITDGSQQLKDIATRLDYELSKIGFKKETHEFTAHLTIARFRSQRNIQEFINVIKKLNLVEIGKMRSEDITIFQSKLTPTGPVYSVIDRFKFVE